MTDQKEKKKNPAADYASVVCMITTCGPDVTEIIRHLLRVWGRLNQEPLRLIKYNDITGVLDIINGHDMNYASASICSELWPHKYNYMQHMFPTDM